MPYSDDELQRLLARAERNMHSRVCVDEHGRVVCGATRCTCGRRHNPVHRVLSRLLKRLR